MSRPKELDPAPVPDDATGTSAGTDLATEGEDPQIHEELLIEEISIDGMCGVY